MPASRSAQVLPSTSSVVLRALTNADDFMSLEAVAQATNLPVKAVRTALWYLQTVHAAEAVHSGGKLHWFATTEYDTRLRTIDERKKEDEKRAPKGTRRKPQV